MRKQLVAGALALGAVLAPTAAWAVDDPYPPPDEGAGEVSPSGCAQVAVARSPTTTRHAIPRPPCSRSLEAWLD